MCGIRQCVTCLREVADLSDRQLRAGEAYCGPCARYSDGGAAVQTILAHRRGTPPGDTACGGGVDGGGGGLDGGSDAVDGDGGGASNSVAAKAAAAAESVSTVPEREYFCKYKERSHIKDTWVPRSWLLRVSATKLKNYDRNHVRFVAPPPAPLCGHMDGPIPKAAATRARAGLLCVPQRYPATLPSQRYPATLHHTITGVPPVPVHNTRWPPFPRHPATAAPRFVGAERNG